MRRRIVHVAGARPNFMKIAAVIDACRGRSNLETVLVHTGQHYDEKMSDLFFRELGIPEPDLHLGVGGGSHAQQTARIMERFEAVVLQHKPDVVSVVGDVNSTLACSLVAVKLGVPVAHVEAGLRSFDRTMPEEINRLVTDAVSDVLFVSEPSGVENLAREGTAPSRVHFVGNVMIDTLLKHRERARGSDALERLGLEPRSYAVVTLHRPANVDRPEALRPILTPILELAERMPVVFPVHPRTRVVLDEVLAQDGAPSRLRLIDPLGYLDFLRLTGDARIVLTDSGGIQEETTILRVPCVTLRDNTERPITVTQGSNRLAGTTTVGIRAAIAAALQAALPDGPPPPLWDGRAGERIAEILAREEPPWR